MCYPKAELANEIKKLGVISSLPWAQGVGRSNRPAPTNVFNGLQSFWHLPDAGIGIPKA